MRLIGELDDSQQAAKFSSFLLTQGIATQTEEATAGGKCEIWVKDEDQFDHAMQELEAFREDSNNQKYSAAVQKATQISRAEEKKRRQIQKKIVKVGGSGIARKPRATLILIGLCVLVALATDFGDGPANGPFFRILEFVSLSPPAAKQLLSQPDLTPDSMAVRLVNLKRGEIWRVVTPIFIHYGTMHILFNMIWLFQLGQLIENRYGSRWLMILVLLIAAVSNFFQCTVPVGLGGSAPVLLPDYTLITRLGGMSGVIFGLLGYVWMKSLYDRASGFYLPQSTLIIMLGWMLFCMIPGATQMLIGANIANWAHAIGLITGMAIGYGPVWLQNNAG